MSVCSIAEVLIEIPVWHFLELPLDSSLSLSVAQALSKSWEESCFKKCQNTKSEAEIEPVAVPKSALYWASQHCGAAGASVLNGFKLRGDEG